MKCGTESFARAAASKSKTLRASLTELMMTASCAATGASRTCSSQPGVKPAAARSGLAARKLRNARRSTEPREDAIFLLLRSPSGQREGYHVERANLSLTHQVNFEDRKSTRLNSSHLVISYAVFCLKKKKNKI